MKTIFLFIVLISFAGCSMEYTNHMDSEKYLEIMEKAFPELAKYEPEIEVLNGNQVKYYVGDVEEKLLTSILDLKKYGTLRKSAIRMANSIKEVRNSKEIIFEFGTNVAEEIIFKRQINFNIKELLTEYKSKISITDLKKLVGKSVNNAEVFVTPNEKLGDPETVMRFSIDYYLHGISINYVDTTIHSILLFNNDDYLGFNNYSGIYPEGISKLSTKKDVIDKYGEPLIWDTHPTYYRYPDDSLVFYVPENNLKRIIIDDGSVK